MSVGQPLVALSPALGLRLQGQSRIHMVNRDGCAG